MAEKEGLEILWIERDVGDLKGLGENNITSATAFVLFGDHWEGREAQFISVT